MSTDEPRVEAEPESVSLWEDYVDIFYAPSQVFARRENGNFWIPMLVVTVFFGMLWLASTRVLEPVFDLERAVAMVEVMFRDVSAIDGQNRLTWGVGRFLDPDTVEPSTLAVLMRIDLFTIWVTVLLAIGLAVTGRINRQRAAIAGVLMWLIGAIPTFFAMLRA